MDSIKSKRGARKTANSLTLIRIAQILLCLLEIIAEFLHGYAHEQERRIYANSPAVVRKTYSPRFIVFTRNKGRFSFESSHEKERCMHANSPSLIRPAIEKGGQQPDLKSGCKFSDEEESIVINLQAQLGNKWARIATFLPGRTDNDVKNFWSSRQKRLVRILRSSLTKASKHQVMIPAASSHDWYLWRFPDFFPESCKAMRFRSAAQAFFSRLLYTLPQKLKNVSYRHRSRALQEARRLLTDYLHYTRALPFAHAECIASNAPLSLSNFVAKVPFPPGVFAADLERSLRRFISYHPVNEFDFFFESIGLPPSSTASRGIFLSDDSPLLASVSALVHFGFPWSKLGLLYSEEPSIFSSDSEHLVSRLRALEDRGFHRVCVIGISLAFPSVLSTDADHGGEIDLLFQDLRKIFIDFGLAGCVPEDNVDVFLQVARKIRVFYDLGSIRGTLGELMGKNLRIFLDLDESVIAQKLKFFIKLGMDCKKVGPFILGCAEILDFDLESSCIVMPEYLKCVGINKESVISLSQKYPYVMGKNKLGNLPGMMRAMKLDSWFLSSIVGGNQHYLSASIVSTSSNDTTLKSGLLQGLDRVKCVRQEQILDNKLEFLLGIGFGENKITLRCISFINSTKEQLQERFDCLLELGVEYSKLCRMVSIYPKILNQSKAMLHEKVLFLCNDLDCSLDYLDNFPAFLCFDLENRTKPRFKMLSWLKEHGLLKKLYAPATVLATSEKRFIIHLYSIHPAVPKQWLECFSSRCNNYEVG